MMGHPDESVEGVTAEFSTIGAEGGAAGRPMVRLLMTLTSFEAFKELMLDYKREADGVGGVGDRERARVARPAR